MLESFSLGARRRWLRLFALLVMLLVLVAAALAQTAPAKGSKDHKPRATHARPVAQPASSRVLGLPFDRVLRPGLQRELARIHPGVKSKIKEAATGSTSSPPSFGGFLAAPKYQAYDVVDQDNSALQVFASGDFNKDGKPDIATVQLSGTVNVILNQGNGSFGSPISTVYSNYYVGGAAQAIAVDMNKDGYDDLVLLDWLNNTVDVLLSNGDGTFGTPQLFNAAINYVGSMAVGDVNGDGFPDLVVSSSTATFNADGSVTSDIELDTLLNDGKGGLRAASGDLQQIFTLPDEVDTLYGRSIALADVNGDGILDATVETIHYLAVPTVTEDSEHIIMTFIGNGGGVFAPPIPANNVVIPSLTTFSPGYPLVANLNVVDLNNDGFKDIAFSYQDYYIWAALGTGSGTYQPYYNVGAYQAYPTDMMTADINGDSLPELIDAEPGYVGVYANIGNGKFDNTSVPSYGSGLGKYSVLSIADFTGDGTPDVALMNTVDGSVTIFTGVPASPPSLHAGNLINPQIGNITGVLGQAVLDTNGDGYDDLVLFNSRPYFNGPELMTALGDGKGNFLYKDALPGYVPGPDDFIDQQTGDFNGDGLKDLVLHTDQGISLLLSNGDGTFTSKPVQLPSFSCITAKGAIGDLNGDGKLDLVVAYGGDGVNPGCNSGSTPSGIFVLLGNGDGTFQTANFIAIGEEVYEPVLLDTNNDGKLDLILSDVPFDLLNLVGSAHFNTFLLLGNGDGTFQWPPSVLVANNVNAHMMAGDVNGDGKTDLVILTEGNVDDVGDIDPTTAGVQVLLGNGDGTFAVQPLFVPGFYSAGGVLADINGDGKLDLLLSEFTSYDFTDTVVGGVAALGDGDGTFTPVSNFEGGDTSSVILQGDFLKDTAPDAVYVSGQSGSTLVLNQGGTTVTLTADPSSIQEGQSVSVTAVVKAAMVGRPQPTGMITLMEGSTNLGSGTLSGGSTTISVSGLAAGAHTITAIYGGDNNFNVNSNASVSVQVTPVPPPPPPPPPPAVTISASVSSLNLTRGQAGAVTFTALANASFSGKVSFAVTGGAAGMSISIAPSQVSLTSGQSGTAVLVVGTTTPSSELQWPFPASGGASLAALLLLAIPRRLRRKISSLVMAILVAATLSCVLGLAGCGGSSVTVAKKGTTTVAVTATPAGLPAQTISVTVTVQ